MTIMLFYWYDDVYFKKNCISLANRWTMEKSIPRVSSSLFDNRTCIFDFRQFEITKMEQRGTKRRKGDWTYSMKDTRFKLHIYIIVRRLSPHILLIQFSGIILCWKISTCSIFRYFVKIFKKNENLYFKIHWNSIQYFFKFFLWESGVKCGGEMIRIFKPAWRQIQLVNLHFN